MHSRTCSKRMAPPPLPPFFYEMVLLMGVEIYKYTKRTICFMTESEGVWV